MPLFHGIMVTVSNPELFLVSFDSFSPSHHVKWRWGGLSAFAGAGGMGKAHSRLEWPWEGANTEYLQGCFPGERQWISLCFLSNQHGHCWRLLAVLPLSWHIFPQTLADIWLQHLRASKDTSSGDATTRDQMRLKLECLQAVQNM